LEEDLAMALWVTILATVLAGTAALFAFLAFIRTGNKKADNEVTAEQVSELLRNESDRIRQAGDEQARALRQELADNLRGFQETTRKVFREFGESLGADVKEFGERLDKGVKMIDERAAAIGSKLDQDMSKMGEEATKNRDALRQTIETKLDAAATKQTGAAKDLREEMTGSFQSLGRTVSETLTQLSEQQKERLEHVTTALSALTDKQERAQETLKQTVEGRLDAIRSESATKLEEMRKTVDEKLQSTLETRLGESFNRVVEQLERVHKGIGEMQTLAAGVGDLKRVLSNVRVRGTFGEVQLGMILEQFLSPEQYKKNAQVKDDSQERVEFAIKLPGPNADGELLLPVDAKFPQEDYERLVAAAELGDGEAVAEASREIENRIKLFAKTIRDKYIAPPRTTDFAILYLPTEGLYAEVLRRPGLFEQLQREYHVTLTGPTTFTALLNALQMGFRSLAIEKRSSEVWQILGAVRGEFGRYNEVVDKLSKQLSTAAKSVESLGIRTRAMNRTLRDVEKLPEATAEILLGPALVEAEDEESEVSEVSELVIPGK
jgi:DNA recombination protein RmuC